LLGDLGVLYTRTGQYTEALSCYERMVELGLNTAELRYDLSLVYAHQGRTEEARAQVREALALSPQEERFEQFLRELGET